VKSKLLKRILSGTSAGVLAVTMSAGAAMAQEDQAPAAQDQMQDQAEPQYQAPADQGQVNQDPNYRDPNYDPNYRDPNYQGPNDQGAYNQAPPPERERPTSAPLSPEQLRKLVAPIALYPDALVAQILAGASYPTQIVEAERFVQQNPNLRGRELGEQVDQQDWDPSVKALVQFPTVLANLDRDLSWTSELGDAYYSQPKDVMAAVQDLRHKARDAGYLKNTPQQRVTDEGDDLDIAPADPNYVYVPVYNPNYVYGYPVGYWPGFYPWWGVGGPYFSFGIGFGIGPFFGFGWGWPAWGCNWHGGYMRYGGGVYAFHSHAFYNRSAYFHGGYRGAAGFNHGYGRGYAAGRGTTGTRGYAGARGTTGTRGYTGARGSVGARSYSGSRGTTGAYRGSTGAYRGSTGSYRGSTGAYRGAAATSHSYAGTRSGAFSGYSRGGATRGYSSRGQSSMGASHGGGRSFSSGGGHSFGGGGHSFGGGGHSFGGGGGGHSGGGGHGGGRR
jgi:hypothetical protein